MAEPAFRGTLLLLQNRTRRDPESYRDEFLAQLDHFRAFSATVLSQRSLNPQFIAVLNYVCHVGHCFPKDAAVIVNIVLELLRASKGNGLPMDLRLALVKSLILLRAKDLVSTDHTFPLFFELLQERDKTLRKLILTHVVSDIRKANMPGAKNGAQINKRAQNFLFSVMAEDDPVQARCAEMVMIDLYRRRVWSDERTVEVLTKACFSKHTPILRTALRFFLLQMPRITSVDDEDGEGGEEQDPGRTISKLQQKMKIVKKTSKRERVLKRSVRGAKRKYDRQEKEEALFAKQHVDPVRLLRDPQQFVERLLAKLQKTSERFEVRLLYLNVIARTVSEHEVLHLPLYGFLERYMEPSQLHATQLLALSATCVHAMVPPDAIEPLLRTIANHFVSDRSSADAITVGINTIREICKRQPLAMNADLLKDLAEYKNQRGDKGVMMAARALIQLYRDVYPELLPAKLRGSKAGAADMATKPVYGSKHVYTDIPGLELLYQDIDNNAGNDESGSESSSSEVDSSSGEWATDSDSEADADDVDGEFVDVPDSSAEEEDKSEDACPQLAPVHEHAHSAANRTDADGEGPRKRARLEEAAPVSVASQNGAALSESSTDDEDEGVDSDVDEDGEGVASDEENDDEESDDEESEDESEFGWEETSDDEESERDEESTAEAKEEEPASLSAALANANSGADWFEDLTEGMSSRNASSSLRAGSVSSSKALSTTSISSSRLLTDSDFQKINQLRTQHGSHQSLRGKRKERDAQSKKRHDLIHGISNDLDAHDIEHFTEKKRETDKQAKIEQARELRKASSTFELRRKKKSKLNSTHGEHSKRGKLFQMTKRSRRVAAKLKSSVADRATRAKEMQKKDIKFRIKRGWKA
ncbi:SDA1 [Leishmania donovani]|uniref:Protein SDA1 n=1 Tax=Leishmania donovani TaxID=5661 RepID=A0A6J8F8M7_LEIDO|nr:SDA1 [Leishmania donovani]VDZ43818.1 NUC130/3NT_domain/SDA1_putative/Pfam:PF08158/Pfam:PF05285 [Leishmania donovani]